MSKSKIHEDKKVKNYLIMIVLLAVVVSFFAVTVIRMSTLS